MVVNFTIGRTVQKLLGRGAKKYAVFVVFSMLSSIRCHGFFFFFFFE